MHEVQDPPRSRRLIRLIALERLVRGVILIAAGGFFVTHLGSDFGRPADRLMRAVGLYPRRPIPHPVGVKLHWFPPGTLLLARVPPIPPRPAAGGGGGGL